MKFYSLLFVIALCASNINARFVMITEEPSTNLVIKDKKKKKLNWLQKLVLGCMKPEKPSKDKDLDITIEDINPANISPEDRLD